MKKHLLKTLFVLSLVFASCSSSDDEETPRCQECDTIINATVCDNGDGTVEVTSGGVTTTEILGALTVDDFVNSLCAGIVPGF